VRRIDVDRPRALSRELTRPICKLPGVPGHLARLRTQHAGLLRAEPSQITVLLCTEELALHRCGLLGKPSRVLLDIAASLADSPHG